MLKRLSSLILIICFIGTSAPAECLAARRDKAARTLAPRLVSNNERIENSSIFGDLKNAIKAIDPALSENEIANGRFIYKLLAKYNGDFFRICEELEETQINLIRRFEAAGININGLAMRYKIDVGRIPEIERQILAGKIPRNLRLKKLFAYLKRLMVSLDINPTSQAIFILRMSMDEGGIREKLSYEKLGKRDPYRSMTAKRRQFESSGNIKEEDIRKALTSGPFDRTPSHKKYMTLWVTLARARSLSAEESLSRSAIWAELKKRLLLAEKQKIALETALAENDGNVRQAARKLNISHDQMRRSIEDLGIDVSKIRAIASRKKKARDVSKIKQALKANSGLRSETSEALSTPQSTLFYQMERLGIDALGYKAVADKREYRRTINALKDAGGSLVKAAEILDMHEGGLRKRLARYEKEYGLDRKGKRKEISQDALAADDMAVEIAYRLYINEGKIRAVARDMIVPSNHVRDKMRRRGLYPYNETKTVKFLLKNLGRVNKIIGIVDTRGFSTQLEESL